MSGLRARITLALVVPSQETFERLVELTARVRRLTAECQELITREAGLLSSLSRADQVLQRFLDAPTSLEVLQKAVSERISAELDGMALKTGAALVKGDLAKAHIELTALQRSIRAGEA